MHKRERIKIFARLCDFDLGVQLCRIFKLLHFGIQSIYFLQSKCEMERQCTDSFTDLNVTVSFVVCSVSSMQWEEAMLLEVWLEEERQRHAFVRVYESSGLKLWECFDGSHNDMGRVRMPACCSFNYCCR